MSSARAESDPPEVTLQDVVAAIEAQLEAAPFPMPSSRTGSALSTPGGAKHLLFCVGSTRYAIPSPFLVNVERVRQIAALPNVPNWVLGIGNVGSQICSIIDVRPLLGEPPLVSGPPYWTVVIGEVPGQSYTSLAVDRILGFRHLPADVLEWEGDQRIAIPSIDADSQPVSILNMPRLLSELRLDGSPPAEAREPVPAPQAPFTKGLVPS